MGKYVTLDNLKDYAPVDVVGNSDDEVLGAAIDRAEMEFESITGSAFDKVSGIASMPLTAWIDGQRWLRMIARERGPVTAVSAISIRDLLTAPTTWQTVSWNNTNDALYPFVDTTAVKASPDWWTVRIMPSAPVMGARDPYNIAVRWTYTAGFTTTPAALKAIILRLAWWIYKLREAPMGRIVTAELGLMEIPLSIPPDIRADCNLWRRVTY